MEIRTFLGFTLLSFTCVIFHALGKSMKTPHSQPPAPSPLLTPEAADKFGFPSVVAADLNYYLGRRTRREAEAPEGEEKASSESSSESIESGSGEMPKLECGGSGEEGSGECEEPPPTPKPGEEPLVNRTDPGEVDLVPADRIRPDSPPLVLFAVPLPSSESDYPVNVCIDWPVAQPQGWYRIMKAPGLDIRARVHPSHRGGPNLILYGVEVFSGTMIHVYASKYGIRINRKVYRWGATHRGPRVMLTPTWLNIRLDNNATLIIHRTEIIGKLTLLLEVQNNKNFKYNQLGLLSPISAWQHSVYGEDKTPVLVDTHRDLAHPLVSYNINEMKCQVPQNTYDKILRTPLNDFKMANGLFLFYRF